MPVDSSGSYTLSRPISIFDEAKNSKEVYPEYAEAQEDRHKRE
jgi:hypothetical protein